MGYTTHPPLKLGTRYYEADVPVWVDEVPFTGLTADKPLYTATAETEQRPEREEEPIQASTSKSDNVSDSNSGSLQDWKQQFLSSEAAEVRAVIGGIVLVIQDQSATKEEADFEALKGVVEAVAEIRDAVEEERAGGECAGVLVLLPAQGGGKDGIGVEKWEEELLGAGVLGWDVVSWDPIDEGKEKENGTRNEYGELRGMERVREVLEANEWGSSLASGDGLEEIGLLSDDEGEVGFKLEANELEREMFGLRMAVEKTGEEVADEEDREELKVEELEGLMMKMQAIKGESCSNFCLFLFTLSRY